MNNLIDKLKEVEKIWWIAGFFGIVIIVNLLGYGG
jgi:hypothetical protein